MKSICIRGLQFHAPSASSLRAQANEVSKKARRIKLPTATYPDSLVEYVIHPGVGKLAAVRVVPAGQRVHEGASPTPRLKYFDLSAARQIANYDKMGGKIMVIRAICNHVLAGEAHGCWGFRCFQLCGQH